MAAMDTRTRFQHYLFWEDRRPYQIHVSLESLEEARSLKPLGNQTDAGEWQTDR